jgi:hypothetical protein
MPSDIEMGDSDSSITDRNIDLDPAIAARVAPGPERVVHKCKEYRRHPGVQAAESPSIIWNVGDKYERNKKNYWRCGICIKNKLLVIQKRTSSAL